MKFSERYGSKEPTPILEKEDLPDGLRNKIWNTIWISYSFDQINDGDGYSEDFHVLSLKLRLKYFKSTFDERPKIPSLELKLIRTHYFQLKYPEFYDFLEMFASDEFVIIYNNGAKRRNEFIFRCNMSFEEEKAQFRFVNNLVTPLTNQEEIEQIESATNMDEAKMHIKKSIELYRDRNNPNYRNSIKESISAVEATFRSITGKKQKISSAIYQMENEGIHLHKAIKKGIINICGWTRDDGGIRHALMEGDSFVTEAEARFMLVLCSAYVNYLRILYENRNKSA